jgi:CheY-like chemotaxis protein
MGASVLIVDDEGAVRKVANRILTRFGYAVQEVETGEAALSLLETARVDVVLLDMTMAGMSGAETLTQLRARHHGLPVVIVSGFSEDELDVEGVTFLQKPFSSDTLRSAVEAALRKEKP